MKATGIIRRIDDLGRIVIPKEIRKSLKINEGDKLEILVNNDQIILKKHSSIKNIKDISSKVTDSIYSIVKSTIIITDTEKVISVSGKNKKELLNKKISNELFKTIINKEDKQLEKISIVDNVIFDEKSYISIIKDNGDVVGSLIVLDNNLSSDIKKIIKVNSTFLNKYLEE